MTLGSRQETRCTATLPPTDLIAVAVDTIRNIGRSAQNWRPGVKSNPGNQGSGTPIHGASTTR